MSKVYVIATAHDVYRQREFEPGDVVIDPWRMIPDQQGVTVRRLGENKPPMISVLLPTRGRPESLWRVQKTAAETATHWRQVEFVIYFDDDDPTMREAIFPKPPTRTQYVFGPRILLSEAWNKCYEKARGEILMHAGDDITFNTPGWDQRVRDEFQKLPDRIGLVYGDDLSTNFPDLATHGFVHRRWVEAVGYFLPPLFSCDWNDVWISEVATKIGRMVPMPDVVIEHRHYSFEKRDHDMTDREREERGREDDVVGIFQSTKGERERDAEKLRKVMA